MAYFKLRVYFFFHNIPPLEETWLSVVFNIPPPKETWLQVILYAALA